MSQPFAHYFDNYGFAMPQPADTERDRHGHFRGCADWGCAIAACRELGDQSDLTKNWLWMTIEDASVKRRVLGIK